MNKPFLYKAIEKVKENVPDSGADLSSAGDSEIQTKGLVDLMYLYKIVSFFGKKYR